MAAGGHQSQQQRQCLTSCGSGESGRGMLGPTISLSQGNMEALLRRWKCSNLSVVAMVSQVYIFINTHQIIHLKGCVTCKLYPNDLDLKILILFHWSEKCP